MKAKTFIMFLFLMVSFFGADNVANAQQKLPVCTLASSEYPSWAAFLVAHELGWINKDEGGEYGPLELKWGVDIVVDQKDYDPSMAQYSSLRADALCVTDLDVLAQCLKRKSVGVLATSTSYGADALFAENFFTDIAQLKGVPVYGLGKSVALYVYVGNLKLHGLNPDEFPFVDMDPGAAALKMQQMLDPRFAMQNWEPFVTQTKNKRKGGILELGSSRALPGHIVDMVVMPVDFLEKPHGHNSAMLIIDIFMMVNERLNDSSTRDETLVMLGERFASFDIASMRKVVDNCRFYGTIDLNLSAMGEGTTFPFDPENRNIPRLTIREVMPKLVQFAMDYELTDRRPTVGYGSAKDAPGVNFRIDPNYLKAYAAGRK